MKNSPNKNGNFPKIGNNPGCVSLNQQVKRYRQALSLISEKRWLSPLHVMLYPWYVVVRVFTMLSIKTKKFFHSLISQHTNFCINPIL